jgi:hypothetical protein
VTVDLSAAPTASTWDQYGGVGFDAPVAEQLAVLNHDLQSAIHSYLGLRLVLVEHRQPVTLTAFGPEIRPGDIRTSLRVSLGDGPSSVDPASTITFYAGTPGTFVDLAADWTYARHRQDPPSTTSQPSDEISLDDDLVPLIAVSEVTGWERLSTINRAIGMLIGDGHEPDDAHRELDRRAEAAGVSPATYATHLTQPPV